MRAVSLSEIPPSWPSGQPTYFRATALGSGGRAILINGRWMDMLSVSPGDGRARGSQARDYPGQRHLSTTAILVLSHMAHHRAGLSVIIR